MKSKQNNEMDKAWNSIFKKYGIISAIDHDGIFEIKAAQMKEYREPRLLAKQDHDYDRPELFKKHYLSILPISRSKYIIGHMSLYLPLNIKWEDANDIINVAKPLGFDTFSKINSETVAINSAVASGILQDFLGYENLMPSGANGRMGTGEIEFRVDNLLDHDNPYTIKVENAQMEIDAGFETDDSLFIVEAKCASSHDFLIRQLYFPYRYWSTQTSKTVNPVFLFYIDGVYHLILLTVEDPLNYNSVRIEKYKKYRIIDDRIALLIQKALPKQVIEDKKTPFPQADSMDKVISICTCLSKSDKPVGSFTLLQYMMKTYGSFSDRQVLYYVSAANYLRVAKRTKPGFYELTPRGKEIMNLKDANTQKMEFAHQILIHSIFLACMQYRIKRQENLKNKDYVEFLKTHPKCKLKGEMLKRRTHTVKQWIEWIINLK